jgi:equilibrative nucleoside transporter 1/2/3
MSILSLSFLTALLILSTFTQVLPGIFFSFVLLNGIAQAAAGSYLQTSVVAVASLFGSSAMQAVMSGQAAVAVIVSGVQVLTSAASVWGVPEEIISSFVIDGESQKRSAFVFFSLSTIFLVITAAAHRRFVALPVYNIIVERKSLIRQDESDFGEREDLVPSSRGLEISDRKHQILSVAKANVIYEVAVAFVFIVTMVSPKRQVLSLY